MTYYITPLEPQILRQVLLYLAEAPSVYALSQDEADALLRFAGRETLIPLVDDEKAALIKVYDVLCRHLSHISNSKIAESDRFLMRFFFWAYRLKRNSETTNK